MKKLIIISLIGLLFSSCAMHKGIVFSSAQINAKGFKVIKIITGSAHATYVFGIGGHSKSGLVNEAKQNIYDQIKLESNQILGNFTLDEKMTFVFPIFMEKQVIITAEVIEFQ